jgi:RNA-directed DNA polymerase
MRTECHARRVGLRRAAARVRLMRPSRRRGIGEALAAAFLSAEWTEGALVDRGAEALQQEYLWLGPLVRRVMTTFGGVAPLSRFADLARFIADDVAVDEVCRLGKTAPTVRRFFAPELTMAPSAWNAPPIATTGDLARWLELDVGHLEWLADRRRLERAPADERLRHYVYTWIPKRNGGVRLLESPKPRLKAIQRKILHEILDRIPPHDAAHGFRHGRSVVTNASPHVGRDAVLHLDLVEFFVSITAARVRSLFRALGYPAPVASLLAALCTNRAPSGNVPLAATASWRDVATLRQSLQRHATPHLPQGAPTSPALANACAYGLDVRLTAGATSVGATYTRYADDLVFSGSAHFTRQARRFTALVGGIALDEGFAVNHRKTKLMKRSSRQLVTGLTVNVRPSPPRGAYDELKAILHNAARLGPASQNRAGVADCRAHLRGRIAWVATSSASRAAKLEALFAKIVWP